MVIEQALWKYTKFKPCFSAAAGKMQVEFQTPTFYCGQKKNLGDLRHINWLF